MSGKQKRRKVESAIQSTVVEWLRENNILFCATIGGLMPAIQQRVRAKREGYEAGVPDLIIFEPVGGFHGLCIEFKSANGSLQINQKKWLQRLAARGYYTRVQCDPDLTIAFIKKYLAGELQTQKILAMKNELE